MLATFSIVACDVKAGEWGVAVQSKFLAVGAIVPWAEANVGAIATQAYANTSYGPRGLAMLKLGFSAEETLKKLLETDEGREHRQVGIVDAQGRAAAFTGKECYPWAGHIVGKNFAVQGNLLVSRKTVEAMAQAFEGARGPLWKKLLEALSVGQRAGGDRRGQQSAALIVVKERGGYGEFTDRMIDLRVDDHPQPIEELARLLDLHELYFGPTKEEGEAQRGCASARADDAQSVRVLPRGASWQAGRGDAPGAHRLSQYGELGDAPAEGLSVPRRAGPALLGGEIRAPDEGISSLPWL
jgi:uncharacterized Ntn-hydrolase superfamily protein